MSYGTRRWEVLRNICSRVRDENRNSTAPADAYAGSYRNLAGRRNLVRRDLSCATSRFVTISSVRARRKNRARVPRGTTARVRVGRPLRFRTDSRLCIRAVGSRGRAKLRNYEAIGWQCTTSPRLASRRSATTVGRRSRDQACYYANKAIYISMRLPMCSLLERNCRGARALRLE